MIIFNDDYDAYDDHDDHDDLDDHDEHGDHDDHFDHDDHDDYCSQIVIACYLCFWIFHCLLFFSSASALDGDPRIPI